jgi:hypothetical protein
MAKEFALDIFHLLGQIDKKDTMFYSKLTDEQRKAYSPLVSMRWMSGTRDARQIIFLNELVNRFVFNMGDHKELLYKLQCAASSGTPRRYNWMSAKTAGNKKNKGLEIVMQYYDYGVREAKSVMPLLGNEDILLMAEELGFQKEELAKLKKELK